MKPEQPRRDEHTRLLEAREGTAHWRQWGPYLSERQWGTVREDYSENGDAWDYFPHDHARSRAYRWGEDGLAGFCDDKQRLCFALALWNGSDPILKERLFGLTNGEGNHGEDVKGTISISTRHRPTLTANTSTNIRMVLIHMMIWCIQIEIAHAGTRGRADQHRDFRR